MHNENIPSIEYNYWMSKLKVKLLNLYIVVKKKENYNRE